MELTGKVTEIIYSNEKNNYSVFLFRTEEKSVMCVGYIAYIKIGDKYSMIGDYTEHANYGRQFKVETYEKIIPTGEEEIVAYLSSGYIKGIGEKIAERIVDKFGVDSIEVIKNNPELLADIKGVSLEKAQEISHMMNEEWSFLQISSWLQKYDLGITSINKIYKEFGNNAIEIIKNNPYILIETINNMEFNIIDRIANDLDIEKTDSNRIKSGIKYCLLNSITNGNTCTLKENLLIAVENFLNVPIELIENALLDLKKSREVIIDTIEDEEYIFLYKIHMSEMYISAKLNDMSNKKILKSDIHLQLSNIEKAQNIILTEIQKEAIHMAYENNVSVITGGPGTGKTTIIKCLIKLLEKDGLEVSLCAPTGRAAKRMTELTGIEAKTIHRLLEINKIDDNQMRFDIEVNELEKDVVIIDEASMIDTILFNHVLKALRSDTKLILVGDVDQLPSVGAGDVLNDIIKSNTVKHIYLDEIFRQAKESLIIVNAHKVNNGETPILNEKAKDFFFIQSLNQQHTLDTIVDLCSKRLLNYGDFDKLKDIQVICPSKRGDVGTRNLNKCLQFALNEKSKVKKEKNYGQTIFRVGDKVMQTKNNYDISWTKHESGLSGVGIFNGDMGYITNIDTVNNMIEVQFDDDKIVVYTQSVIEELEHAYAITIHKSQGSEFDVVVIPIVKGPPMLYTRNLLYTGITRAKKMLILVGDEIEINKMIQNTTQRKRNTGLKYKLIQGIQERNHGY